MGRHPDRTGRGGRGERIKGELNKLQAAADFPVKFLPPTAIRDGREAANIEDAAGTDTILLYAAGGPANVYHHFRQQGKQVIFFVRHNAVPVSLWYEIVSPALLRGHSDTHTDKDLEDLDVVVDCQDEITWRLRALCGLKNTMGSKMITIGGASGWASPSPELAKSRFQLDIQDVPYERWPS